MHAPYPYDEEDRLEVLRHYHILDSPAEAAFDDITHLAAHICSVPVSIISLTDQHRQWFKSSVGISASETPRGTSFCTHAILQPDVLVVPDAREDARFADNPIVTGKPYVRFYAGAPLLSESGHRIGTLCVVDFVPRDLQPVQRDALEALARQVMAQLELRRQLAERTSTNAALQAEVREKERAQELLKHQEQFLRKIIDTVPNLIFVKDWEGRFTLVNDFVAGLYGTTVENLIGKRDCDFTASPEDAEHFLRDDREVMRSLREKFILEEPVANALGQITWVQTVKRPLIGADGKAGHVLGIGTDISHRKKTEEHIRALNAELENRLCRIESLHSDLEGSNRELKSAYEATIEGWSRALDLRDKETEGHCRRVAEMTLRLAEVVGVTSEELLHIRRGALLHDIGKMGVPDGILLKPGPLTADERRLMERHTLYAYEMLSPISFLHPALDIPYCHHEKWDGTGYPRGLREEEIPLAARLFALVDVWDALCSDRPYRASWPRAKVRDHIRSLSGTHFDPRFVEVFLRQTQRRWDEEIHALSKAS